MVKIYRCIIKISIISSKNFLESKKIISIIIARFKLIVINNIIGLSSYKLVRILNNYVNTWKVETLIIIWSNTTQR